MTMSGKKTKPHYLGAMYFDDEYQEKKRLWAVEEAELAAKRPAMFDPRYKRYAAWPVVIWCRWTGHQDQGAFHSGDVTRCVNCGDQLYEATETETPGPHSAEC